jgi:hypothetical protein
MTARTEEIVAARRRAAALARVRALAQASAGAAAPRPRQPRAEPCELCGTPLPDDHRHLLHLDERRIVCSCEACWALHSGDAQYRPAGMRTLWLEGFELPVDLWARFGIPIALAFFLRSSVTDGVVAFYPSPGGATESELSLDAWEELVERNPVLAGLDADVEALVVNRLADPAQYAIAPIDRCYELVGVIKTRWEGISGGGALDEAVPAFFAALRERAAVARAEALR